MKSIFRELIFSIPLIIFYSLISIYENSVALEITFLSLCIILNLEALIRTSQSNALLLLSIFSITYPVYILIAALLDVKYHIYDSYQSIYYTCQVFFIQTISLRIIFFRLEKNNKLKSPISESLEKRKNNLIFIFLLALITLMLFFSIYDKKNLVISGDYNVDSESSIFFEYCIPVLLCLWLYSTNKIEKIIVITFFFIFMLLPLVFGRRLPFSMVALLFINLYFFNSFSRKKILIFSFSAFIFLSVIAVSRVGGDVSISDAILAINSNGIMENNQGGVVISAATYLGLIDDNYFNFEFRIKSFLGILTSAFLPSSMTIPETYINFQALKFSNIPGNGGLPGIYFYIWLGWFGVIFFSVLINKLIFSFGNKRIRTILVIFILSTFPRWYAYNMIILFKMTFWLFLLILIIDFIDNRTRIYKTKKLKLL